MNRTWLIVLGCLTLEGLYVTSTPAEALTAADFSQSCRTLAAAGFSDIPDAPTQIVETKETKGEDVPTYCHVKGYISPSIGFRLALPWHWNGKFVEGGCGRHCGADSLVDKDGDWFLATNVCGPALRKGYACIWSDMGHPGTGSDALWGFNSLQAKLDWGFRATHVAALAGKAIVERFYAEAPKRSYFNGCSTGGRQALQEAQRFPWDFDGIIAGAPPVDLASLYVAFAWEFQATRDHRGRVLVGESEGKLLTDAAMAKCDLDDGVKDGIISDPLHCAFDPSELACKSGQTRDCLRSEQLAALAKIYAGPATPEGVRLTLGSLILPGNEYTVLKGLSGLERAKGLVADGLRYLFFFPEESPTWTLRDFDFSRDYKRLGVMGSLYDASNPDLRKFKAAGGKILVYQGMNDSFLARQAIDYYETVERTMGGRKETQSFFRLFVLPGVDHCGGGDGADTVDYLSALEAWVEEDKAPDWLIAARLKGNPDVFQKFLHPPSFPLDPQRIQFTRPVYPYPIGAKYTGRGDPNDAANFTPSSH